MWSKKIPALADKVAQPNIILETRNNPKRNAKDIHFLHIGKCAGSQIAQIARQVNRISDTRKIIKHRHDVFLRNINAQAYYFFSIRDPMSRFKSGFYSRKRKGPPRLNVEWNIDDTFAFETFEHANDLAESLFEKTERGHKAWAAMKSIRHTAQNQSDWFYCRGSFLYTRPPIWILRQEHFDADLATFFTRENLDLGSRKVKITSDPRAAHANDYTDIPALSEKASEKLALWYAQDIAFYDMCEDWMMQQAKDHT